jgi:pSer/pThr/pTyr-binding forkhead associated (FHA) protein
MSHPFLLYDAPDGARAVELTGGALTIGRRKGCDVALAWDPEVSRLHAELARLGGVWVVRDDGMSRNGTFLNGTRVMSRRRLRGGDALTVGGTLLAFHDDATSAFQSTRDPQVAAAVAVTPAQKRVLTALCRPLAAGDAAPATNRQIAAELVITVETVKTTLGTLFERFGLEHHPRHGKRAALAQRALALNLSGPGCVWRAEDRNRRPLGTPLLSWAPPSPRGPARMAGPLGGSAVS